MQPKNALPLHPIMCPIPISSDFLGSLTCPEELLPLTHQVGVPPYWDVPHMGTAPPICSSVWGDGNLNGVMVPVMRLGVAGSGYCLIFPICNYSSALLYVSRDELFIM